MQGLSGLHRHPPRLQRLWQSQSTRATLCRQLTRRRSLHRCVIVCCISHSLSSYFPPAIDTLLYAAGIHPWWVSLAHSAGLR